MRMSILDSSVRQIGYKRSICLINSNTTTTHILDTTIKHTHCGSHTTFDINTLLVRLVQHIPCKHNCNTTLHTQEQVQWSKYNGHRFHVVQAADKLETAR